MKAVALLLAGLLVAFGGCVNRPSTGDAAHIVLEIQEHRSEERRSVLRQVLHDAFDWNSVAPPQLQAFYEVLNLLHRSDLGDERVVAIEFVSDDEAVVSLHRLDRSIVGHPSGTRRVQRRAGFWIVAPSDLYRSV